MAGRCKKRVMKKLSLCLLLLGCAALLHAQKTIQASEAREHLGDSVQVCGLITGGKYLRQSQTAPTLLDMGGKYPNQQLTLVIPKASRDSFSYEPEKKLLNQQVCVYGRIQHFKGKPEIVLHRESQVKIMGSKPAQ
jgi:hypothetical protein